MPLRLGSHAMLASSVLACIFSFAAVGCAGETGLGPTEPGATPPQFVVSSDVDDGVLTRVDYVESGASVEFRAAGDDGIAVLTRFPRGGVDPTLGFAVDAMLPSEAFAALTGLAVPDALTQAEERALLAGAVAPPPRGQPSESVAADDIGVSVQALTGSEFRAKYCATYDICKTGQTGNQSFKSGSRRTDARIAIDALEGNLVLHTRKYQRGWRTMEKFHVYEGQTIRYDTPLSGVQRILQVIVEKAEGDKYHIRLNWNG